MKKRVNKKLIVAAVSCAVLIGSTLSGSLAWLKDSTEEVKNTFSTSDIGVYLLETGAGESNGYTKNYKMIPGWSLDKDPVAGVTEDSADCYLFVKIEENGGKVTVGGNTYGFDNFLAYEIAEGWTLVPGTENVYSRVIDDATGKNEDYPILKNNEVTVLTTVTKEMMNAIDSESNTTATDDDIPSLKFTAYAVQLKKDADTPFSVAEAWAIANNLDPNSNGGGQG